MLYNVDLRVWYVAVSRVRYMRQSHTVIAGSTVELLCRIWGWPLPHVTWHRLGSQGPNSRLPLHEEDGRFTLRDGVAVAPPGGTVINATLVISDVRPSDRDTYVCDISSYVDGAWRYDNGTVLVRVKGHCSFDICVSVCNMSFTTDRMRL